MTHGLQCWPLYVAAVNHGVPWIVRLLWLSFILSQGLRVATPLLSTTTHFSEVTWYEWKYWQTDFPVFRDPYGLPYMQPMHSGNYKLLTHWPTALMVVPTRFDLLLLILTSLRAIWSPTSLRADSIVLSISGWVSHWADVKSHRCMHWSRTKPCTWKFELYTPHTYLCHRFFWAL